MRPFTFVTAILLTACTGNVDADGSVSSTVYDVNKVECPSDPMSIDFTRDIMKKLLDEENANRFVDWQTTDETFSGPEVRITVGYRFEHVQMDVREPVTVNFKRTPGFISLKIPQGDHELWLSDHGPDGCLNLAIKVDDLVRAGGKEGTQMAYGDQVIDFNTDDHWKYQSEYEQFMANYLASVLDIQPIGLE